MIERLQPLGGLEYDEISLPDVYLYDNTEGQIEPDDFYVISRTKEGLPLSRYGDDVWDMTPYSTIVMNLYFGKIESTELRREAKRLMFLYYIFGGSGRGGATKSGRTVYLFYQNFLHKVVEYVAERGTSIKALFEDDRLLKNYVFHQHKTGPHCLVNLRTFMEFLRSKSNTATGIAYRANSDLEILVSRLVEEYFRDVEQTEVIPVEIYANAAKQRWEHIEEIERYLPNIFAFLEDYRENKHFARHKGGAYYKQGQWKKIPGFVYWDDAVKAHGLQELFEKHAIARRDMILSFIGKIQGTCRHLIYMYTGMRHNEGNRLMQNCFRPATPEMPALIKGVETKIHGVPTDQEWVTVPEIGRPIDLLTQIGNFIAQRYFPYLQELPLFVKSSFMMNNQSIKSRYTIDDVIPTGQQREAELKLDIDSVTVRSEYIDEELKALEPLRNWEDHKWLKVGEPWKFNYHQYRRSLAVYALGSGLVSIFAIKDQFGHLMKLMTQHYGNGSLVAKPLLGAKHREHIANYIKKISSYIEAMTFVKNVPFADETLFGGGGVFHEKNQRARTPEAREQILANMDKTIKDFKSGRMRYKETPMGGCTTIEPCDKHLMPSLTECLSCDMAIHRLSKLDIAIDRQRKFVAVLAQNEPNTIQYRTGVATLQTLEEYRETLRSRENG